MRFLTFLLLSCTLFSLAHAENTTLKPFTSGSYQQIVSSHAGKPFLLSIWSITCPSCIKDMEVLHAVHKTHPELPIVMLSTDDSSERATAIQILEKNQLTDVEHWIYSDENTQKLQFEIDPQWYGELPRSYFFDKTGQRDGVSGVLSEQDYQQRIGNIMN
jgi:thiol-disulfide isomerase/thioredoxin